MATSRHATHLTLKRLLSWAVPLILIIIGFYLLSISFAPVAQKLPFVQAMDEQRIYDQLSRTDLKNTSDRLYIPKIGVSIDVVTGNDESTLLKGAWHRKPENGNPQDGGNFVLSAHRFDMGYTPAGTIKKSPFYNIDRLSVGDEVLVDYDGGRYTYVISRTYQVDPTQVSIERRTDEPRLTLYSCTLRGSADGRVVVEAVPTE